MVQIIHDKNISLKAKGVYLIISELIKNNEPVGLRRIKDIVKDGETSIRGAVNELLDNKYIEREMKRGEGKIRGIEYKIIK